MVRKSSIDRLPAKIRDLIGSLREQGRTIDEIHAKLEELDVDVSRSALGRYTQQIDQLAEVLREGRVVSQAVMDKIEDAGDDRVARMNIELMHTVVTKLLLGQTDIDAKEAAFLAGALKNLAAAGKADMDREIKIREQAARQAREAMARQLDAATEAASDAGERGLSAERVAQLRRDFLGVRGSA